MESLVKRLPKVLPLFARSVSTAPIQKQEYASRRSKLVEKISRHSSTQKSTFRHLVVIPSLETQYSSPHVPYKFRQDSYFRYVTGLTEPNSVYVLEIHADSSEDKRNTSRLFVKEMSQHDKLWDGPSLGVNGASNATGISCTMPVSSFPEYLRMALSDLASSNGFLWYSTPFIVRAKEKAPINHSIYSTVSELFSESSLTNANLRNPNPLLDELRLIKSPSELQLLRKAVECTSRALQNTMRSAYSGICEAELDARFRFESALLGCEVGYPPVVGGGNRANIIHYLKNSETVEDGQLVLMDVGCECEGYTADVSRTWPVNGRFSPQQRLLHDILVRVQAECQAAANPESSLQKLYDLMTSRLAFYLNEEKVLNLSKAEFSRVGSLICPHHIGHFLGLDVHDTASIPYSRNFEPGMVFPLEPGIYFPQVGGRLSVPSEFRGLGLRLEDDYIFTPEGKAEKLNDCVPFKATDLEALIGSKQDTKNLRDANF